MNTFLGRNKGSILFVALVFGVATPAISKPVHQGKPAVVARSDQACNTHHLGCIDIIDHILTDAEKGKIDHFGNHPDDPGYVTMHMNGWRKNRFKGPITASQPSADSSSGFPPLRMKKLRMTHGLRRYIGAWRI